MAVDLETTFLSLDRKTKEITGGRRVLWEASLFNRLLHLCFYLIKIITVEQLSARR